MYCWNCDRRTPSRAGSYCKWCGVDKNDPPLPKGKSHNEISMKPKRGKWACPICETVNNATRKTCKGPKVGKKGRQPCEGKRPA